MRSDKQRISCGSFLFTLPEHLVNECPKVKRLFWNGACVDCSLRGDELCR